MMATDNHPGVSAASGQVHVSSANGIGWLVLDNPQKHNAMSLKMWQSLIEALKNFDESENVRCVVIRGEGNRAFSAGADLSEKQAVDSEGAMVAMQLTRVGLSTLGEFSKPLIAQVSGYCLGAGLAIAVACDLRLVATGATFGIPAARLGLAYHYSEMKRLTDLVGPSSAKRLVFTADRITAGLALQLGLVDEVATAEHLNGAVQALALSIASNAPLTLKAAKRAVALALSECTEVDTTRCDEQASFCLASEDYREGLHAFQEKRRPVFRGK